MSLLRHSNAPSRRHRLAQRLATSQLHAHHPLPQNCRRSAFISAKTGDQVSQCFFRIAADLADVTLTKPELEVATKVVTAQIVNHPLVDEDEGEVKPEVQSKRKGASCSVQ